MIPATVSLVQGQLESISATQIICHQSLQDRCFPALSIRPSRRSQGKKRSALGQALLSVAPPVIRSTTHRRDFLSSNLLIRSTLTQAPRVPCQTLPRPIYSIPSRHEGIITSHSYAKRFLLLPNTHLVQRLLPPFQVLSSTRVASEARTLVALGLAVPYDKAQTFRRLRMVKEEDEIVGPRESTIDNISGFNTNDSDLELAASLY